MWQMKTVILHTFILLLTILIVKVSTVENAESESQIYSLKSTPSSPNVFGRTDDAETGRGKKKAYKKGYRPHHGHGHGHGPHHGGHHMEHQEHHGDLALSVDLNMLAAAVGAIALLLIVAAVCHPFTKGKSYGWDRRSDDLAADFSGQNPVSLASNILSGVEKLYYPGDQRRRA